MTRNKLYVLDGYRGLLAILVILQHLYFLKDPGHFKFFKGPGTYVGVSGFFVLSAFLLTYRLLDDFERSNGSAKRMILSVTQYFIRRFFRIYIVFIAFLLLANWKYTKNIFNGIFNSKFQFIDGVVLRNPGGHLWTIPLEVRYYFFIPLICLTFYKFNRYWLQIWCVGVICVLINELFNPFNFQFSDYHYSKAYKLWCRFTMFFSGSLLAVVYVHLKKIDRFQTTIKNVYIQKLMNLAIVILFLYLFYKWPGNMGQLQQLYGDSFISSIYQCIFIILLIYCTESTNIIIDMLNSKVFRSCGEYSFGLYLFHPAVMGYFKQHELKYFFQTVFAIMSTSFITAMIWFHVLENPLMKAANILCKKIETLYFFKPIEIISANEQQT